METDRGLISNPPFTIRFGDRRIDIYDDEVKELYQQLKKKFEYEEKLQHETKIDKLIRRSTTLGYVEYEDTLIPVGYKLISIKESNPKNGKSIHYYHYFKDSRGNFGFLIKNGMTKPFAKIGKIEDPNSILWKVLHVFPTTKSIPKSFFVNKGVVSNNQRIKAIIDVLLLEGYLREKRKPNSKIIHYLVTQKVNELEFENSIEPLKVQNSPTRTR
ncbi:hypothetical protein [Nitrosopumilus ureiphilus]|uniref:Uncharacterized protein n=1 Tax=Nitrosopumilus ureiphilus TaxID=1470067 RepID=A0A7D5M974_9ARCH|nr:hypothetical protein [Nitrosopumilus ureiphilus]QLH07268.1 hypothetical protein C5F50_09395 [Nitrosopumilus ureiphilus]